MSIKTKPIEIELGKFRDVIKGTVYTVLSSTRELASPNIKIPGGDSVVLKPAKPSFYTDCGKRLNLISAVDEDVLRFEMDDGTVLVPAS